MEFHSNENFESKPPKEPLRSMADKRAIDILTKTTKKMKGLDRFETGLLWKEGKTNFVIISPIRDSSFS